MFKKIFFIVVLIISSSVFSQNTAEKKQKLRGKITDVKTKFPLKSANVLNLNTVIGTVTNRYGEFAITAKKNDTIHISYIGYESIKLIVTNDILNNDKLEIAINPKIIDINEVKVKSHQLVGVLVIDAKNVPVSTPKQIHIDGIAQTFEVGKPQSPNYES
ncbi:MAG TPA: carboxypeptidase-like regulatory domain-containing protein, partial [Flavobacteriaceae bacterium]|nr:carboxypeptidase-like regulatory domain-containing protein [Flavobacteriaceae bacterium]